jgi:outer membrane lipoprotein-sorting protein
MIGVIHLYPEDAKCVELNRETGARASLWDNLADWRGLLTHGVLSLRSEAEQGKNFAVLTLTWPVQTMGDQPEMSRLEIWADPATHLPKRYRGFVEGQAKAVLEFDYVKITPNPSLKPEDIKFEGLSLWSFPAQFVANGKGLENLRYPALATASGAAPTFPKVLEQAAAAVAKIKDYRAEFMLTQKYFRLKMRGKVAESVIREPRFFLFEFDSDFRVNYLNLISPGGKLCFRRDERTYATMGGGAMRAAGTQVMYVDDHRSDFACGESFSHLNLFDLVSRMKWYRDKGKVAVDLVKLGNLTCPRVIMKRTTEPRAAEIQDMQVVFDPGTWLPLRVDYLGNPDQQGFTVIEYQSIKTNLGLKEAELKF